MCGILGIIGPLPAGCDADSALDLLTHRGPDDRGVMAGDGVWLGHRRLSIIDLGPGGHQPMVEPSSGVALTYNGELFNYIELRRELRASGHQFLSSSDTEVLLHSYLEWGEACVEHFNGMWAFLVWDPRSGQAFFSRDRFGVKPLVYAVVDGALAVASEPKALLAAFPQLRGIDETALHDLLAEKRVHHDERTFYAKISSLLPAHRGTFRIGDPRPRLERFWSYPEPDDGIWDEPAALHRLEELITDAVELRLRSDVPVGLTLSGGIDSTLILDAIAGARAANGSGVSAYTSVYAAPPGEASVDERRWAHTAADKYDNVSLAEVPAPRESWLEVLPKIVWHMDGPCFSPAAFPMWMIMQRARTDGIPVLLEGQGADELFGGYAHYAAFALLDRISDAAPVAALAAFQAGTRAGSVKRLLKDLGVAAVPSVRAWELRRTTLRTALHSAGNGKDAGRRVRLEQRLLADFSRDTLPGFLRYADAMSMAHSIETRMPFLDYRVVEHGVRLAPAARIWGGETKHILRAYLRRAGQSEIADRRDKKGYPTPVSAWLAEGDGAVLRERLLDRDARVLSIVDRSRLGGVITQHAHGSYAAGDVLYALLATELWWQQLN